MKKKKEYAVESVALPMVLDELVGQIAKNGIQRSIKPVLKTDDFALFR